MESQRTTTHTPKNGALAITKIHITKLGACIVESQCSWLTYKIPAIKIKNIRKPPPVLLVEYKHFLKPTKAIKWKEKLDWAESGMCTSMRVWQASSPVTLSHPGSHRRSSKATALMLVVMEGETPKHRGSESLGSPLHTFLTFRKSSASCLSVTISLRFTMFLWFSCRNIFISLTAVMGNPSFSFSSLTFFNATSSPGKPTKKKNSSKTCCEEQFRMLKKHIQTYFNSWKHISLMSITASYLNAYLLLCILGRTFLLRFGQLLQTPPHIAHPSLYLQLWTTQYSLNLGDDAES